MMGRLKTDIIDKVNKITISNAILNTIFTNLQQNMEGLAGKVENKIQTMDGIGTEFNSLIEKVKYLETDNIKAKVDNIITNNAILNKNITFIKTEVEKHINRLQTDITTLQNNMKGLAGKVENKKGLAGIVEKKIQTMDGLGTELNSLGEKVTDMEISIKKSDQDSPKMTIKIVFPKFSIRQKLHISKNIIENLLLRPELHYCASGFVWRDEVNDLTLNINWAWCDRVYTPPPRTAPHSQPTSLKSKQARKFLKTNIPTYNSVTNTCKLCISEKMFIIF